MPVMTIVPDDKDWTWVLESACPECGFDARAVAPTSVAARVRGTAPDFVEVLDREDALRRPSEGVWSPTEYACHVRDVHRVFARRVRLMLAEDDPEFENWDQDRTALEERYAEQRPAEVAKELVEAASEVADVYDGVPPADWGRTGRRSDGSVFTIGSLATYHLHDVVHHLWDVRRAD
jgi:hypothetical protein